MKLSVLLLLLLICGACARPDRTPIPLPSESELLERLSQGSELYQTLDGEAKVAVTVNGKFVSTRQFLLLEKPDRFRTDVLSPFGQLVMQLAVDRNDLRVFLNTTVPGSFYQGAASDENLVRFTRLPVNLKDMVRLLLYDPPLISGQSVLSRTDGQDVMLEISGGQRDQKIIFDRKLRPIESRYYQHGALWLKVTYDSFAEEDGFPQKIKLELPEEKTSASIRFSQTRSNVLIPAERFVIMPPANAILEDFPRNEE